MYVVTYAAVSSIDRYASACGLSNQSGSMATQVGSAVGDCKLASVTSVQHEMALRRASSITSGRYCVKLFTLTLIDSCSIDANYQHHLLKPFHFSEY